MATQRTLSIIKPDAVAKQVIGPIYTLFEEKKLRIIAARMLLLTQEQAEAFYAVHQERPFFDSLVQFMISGKIMVQVLEGDNAVSKLRQLMGATNPADAEPDTIRAQFGSSIENNAVHGSDSLITAQEEIKFFFPELAEN